MQTCGQSVPTAWRGYFSFFPYLFLSFYGDYDLLISSKVVVNGAPDQTTSYVSKLAYVDGMDYFILVILIFLIDLCKSLFITNTVGTIWQENVDDMWWGKTKPTDAWSPSAGTSVDPTK